MDRDEVKQMMGRVAADVGGGFTVAMAYLGDRLGLFRALAGKDPCTSTTLAAATKLDERYVREWLHAMVAAEYVESDPGGEHFHMTAEQAAVLAEEGGPVFLGGSFQFAIPTLGMVPRFLDIFRDGGGLSYQDMGDEIIESIDRMHRPGFEHHLTQNWLPRVPGIVERLQKGIRVLDVGCGLGRSTLALGQAFPDSTVHGLDPDSYSIQRARELADGAANLTLLETTLDCLPVDEPYDFILAFDCIHDMADPVSELKRIRELLADGGTCLWVEPSGSADPMMNRNPAARMRAALSPLHCLTVSLAEGGAGLGTIIGESGARSLALEAGFESFELLPIKNPMQHFFRLM